MEKQINNFWKRAKTYQNSGRVHIIKNITYKDVVKIFGEPHNINTIGDNNIISEVQWGIIVLYNKIMISIRPIDYVMNTHSISGTKIKVPDINDPKINVIKLVGNIDISENFLDPIIKYKVHKEYNKEEIYNIIKFLFSGDWK